MKKTRRLLCLLLTVVLALSLCAIPAAAADDQARSDDPVVFVHGLLGWGQRDRIYRIMPYWGMTTGSLTDYLSAKGYETYAASVGPLSSAWDRACELYAQLVGTRTDYGVKHAQDFEHERYGIDYKQPLFDGWGTKRAVNLVGHSFGGATTRLFLEILTNGCPEEVAAAKAAAIDALMKREVKDNAIAAEKGLKPYTLLNVELHDGADGKSGYLGWYYVTLAVDGKIHTHMETGLNHDIANGKVSETPARERYFTAGTLKEADVDYVFNNVGFSSTSDLYSLPISDAVRERAEKTLAEREKARLAVEAPDTPQNTQAAVRYYPINEAAARRAQDANSYRDYVPGSATAEYRAAVDRAAELAQAQKKRVDPMYHEKIDSLLDTYARKLAANMNHGYEIDARVPSILIAGGSNFPVRQKEKQNAAHDSNMQEWQYIQGLLDKIRSTGMGGIRQDDPRAIPKLQKKLAGLEKAQETMKAVNAYYRKHGTLDGCPHLSPENLENLKADMASGWHYEKKPFQSWELSNNNAEIRRVRQRIEILTRANEVAYVGWEFDGGHVEANRDQGRLQVFFDGKPEADARQQLKENGFRWAPSVGAWQRLLNDNAYHASDRIACIQPFPASSPRSCNATAAGSSGRRWHRIRPSRTTSTGYTPPPAATAGKTCICCKPMFRRTTAGPRSGMFSMSGRRNSAGS